MTNQRRPSPTEMIDTLPAEQREAYAEYLRERIYSTLTLLAVMTTLWRHSHEYTAIATLLIIIGTVGALWLATITANRMSRRIVHGHENNPAHERKFLRQTLGLLEPAYVPAFLVVLSMLGIISLSTALLAGVIALVVSMFLFSVLSGRKTQSGTWRILIFSVVQMAIGLTIVWLKIALE